jgi:hypothetical protein
MPTISGIRVTGYEFILPTERAYGMARGLNFRRTCALVDPPPVSTGRPFHYNAAG